MKNRQKPRGRHPYQRLSAVTIRSTTAPGRYADGHGLYLHVDPSGAKRWIWRGVIQRRRHDLGLGSVLLVSLSEAREAAFRIRRQARGGGNPLIERQRELRPVPTFKTAAKQVHAEHSKAFKNAKHTAQWLASLETDVFPAIGHRPVNSVSAADILSVLTPIWTVKPETARRLKQRIKVVFDWAKASGHCQGDNPTDGLTKVLPKHRGEKQHHAALPYRDVPAFISTLRTIPDMQDTVRLGLELLIVTATRTNEVQRATWREIDLAAQTWTIPAERMKSGCEHRIPLSPRAVEILEAAQAVRRPDRDWIFPGDKPQKPLSNMTFLKAARRITTATLTTHGFRSSFRDWSAERTNVPRDVCEMALAHTLRDKTEAAYKRTDLFERRRHLMELWAQFVTGASATVLAHSA